MNDNLLQTFRQNRQNKYKKSLFIFIIWLFIMLLGFFFLELELMNLIFGIPAFLRFFFTNFFPPDFSGFTQYIDDIIQMLTFSFISMVTATVLSLIMGFLMTRSINPSSIIRFIIRALASLLRNIPTVIWGSVLVYVFGIGPVSGIIALTFSMTGFLAKAYADTIEEISGATFEALDASGASTLQKIFNGIIPQFIPSFVNWTLYAFEIGVRASSILGIVGAGGIGILVTTRINLFEYQDAMALVLYIIIVVLVVEYASTQIRRRVR